MRWIFAAVLLFTTGCRESSPKPLKVKMIDCLPAAQVASKWQDFLQKTAAQQDKVGELESKLGGTPWILESYDGQKCFVLTERTEHTKTALIELSAFPNLR
jgi:hypothetical protein